MQHEQRSSSYRGNSNPNRFNSNRDKTKERPPKGHDAQLKDAQDNGKPCVVTLLNGGEEIKGNIAMRDRYTITLRVNAGALKEDGTKLLIVYKHAIESIQIIQPVAA